MDVRIEVAATPEMSSTERGRLLERFARKLLESQHFRVTSEVRITGQEVDLLAEEINTGEKILVECKAYRSTVAAEVIHKLYGQVTFGGYASGWLLTTFDLGKDAKGLRDQWSNRAPDERRRLQIYDPASLIERLEKARLIVAPSKLRRIDGQMYSDDATLLISPWGIFWAIVLLDPQTRLRKSAYLFAAESGAPIVEASIIAQVQTTDSSLNELVWEVASQTPSSRTGRDLSGVLQNIVKVPMADDWADYRPARPQDFVGRQQLQRDLIDIFDKVRFQQTETRLFAIKAPSGWGKSSFALKVAERANSSKGRNYFVYAVDSRAATSRRFGELAVYSAIRAAMDAGFIPRVEGISIGGATAPFASETAQQVLDALRVQNGVICLIFDQFEELLYKEELAIIFDEMRILCDAIVECQGNIVIGFSWKTDGMIPPEHKAYHLWHNLADRRREFELAPLRPNEVLAALNKFSTELGQKLSPQLRRTLSDHCQGYPWLLKKLCVHVLNQVRGGLDQSQILLTSLKIEELFDRDLQNLSSTESSCVKQIAIDAPAEFFRIAQSFGEGVVQALLEKRLVIRSGARLSLYWDIFRDYLLTGKVPYIPTTYVPQSNIDTYLAALRALMNDGIKTYESLAIVLNVSVGTADNVVRDLVMIGNAEANRISGAIKLITTSAIDAEKAIVSFCRSHAIIVAITDAVGYASDFTVDELIDKTRTIYPRSSITDFITETYAKRILQWCVAADIIEQLGGHLRLRANSVGVKGLTNASAGRRGQRLFFGEASPAGVLLALEGAIQDGGNRSSLQEKYGRKAVYVLRSLGLLDARGNVLLLPGASSIESIRIASKAAPTLVAVVNFLSDRGGVATGLQVGRYLAEQFDFKWSEGSKKAVGTGLKRWAKWLKEEMPPHRVATDEYGW